MIAPTPTTIVYEVLEVIVAARQEKIGCPNSGNQRIENALSIAVSSATSPNAAKDKGAPSGPETEALWGELSAAEAEKERLLAELAEIEEEIQRERVKETSWSKVREELDEQEEDVAGRLNDALTTEWLWLHEEESKNRLVMKLHDQLTRTLQLLPQPSLPVGHQRTSRLNPSAEGGPSVQVSPLEINAACGYLLELLQLLCVRHRFTPTKSSLLTKGAESCIVTQNQKGKSSTYDFFIKQKLFSWSTF